MEETPYFWDSQRRKKGRIKVVSLIAVIIIILIMLIYIYLITWMPPPNYFIFITLSKDETKEIPTHYALLVTIHPEHERLDLAQVNITVWKANASIGLNSTTLISLSEFVCGVRLIDNTPVGVLQTGDYIILDKTIYQPNSRIILSFNIGSRYTLCDYTLCHG